MRRFLVLCFILQTLITSGGEASDIQGRLLKRFYFIATGNINGTYYPLGTGIARLLSNEIEGILAIAESTTGSVANIRHLRKGDVAFALVQSDTAYDAFYGRGAFQKAPFPELRVLSSLYSEAIHIAVLEKSGITSIEDLKGKTLAIGEKGSGTAVNAQILLRFFNISEFDFTPRFLSFSKSTSALADGFVDAVFFTGGVPSDGFVILCDRIPVRLLSFSKTDQERLANVYSFLSPETIPMGTYKGQKQDVSTVSLRAVLTTTEKLDPILARRTLELIFRKTDFLSDFNAIAKKISFSTGLSGIERKMLHDGAVEFFREKNLLQE